MAHKSQETLSLQSVYERMASRGVDLRFQQDEAVQGVRASVLAAADAGLYSCQYRLPWRLLTGERQHLFHAVEYLMRSLLSHGFSVRYFPPDSIRVSWLPRDVRREARRGNFESVARGGGALMGTGSPPVNLTSAQPLLLTGTHTPARDTPSVPSHFHMLVADPRSANMVDGDARLMRPPCAREPPMPVGPETTTGSGADIGVAFRRLRV
jgi:hypothetical protein